MTEPTSALPEFPPETICSSCGNFVGAYARCPYCGAEHKRRMSIRFFRYFSIIVSLGGLFLIWLAARGIEAPLIRVKDIQPLNAFAYVRVEGDVTNSRAYGDGGISIRVNDGTGEIEVRAYADTGKELVAKDRLPSPGDRVSVEGTLQIREDRGPLLIVNVAEKVNIRRVTVPITEIAALGSEHIGQKMRVKGTVTGTLKFSKGTSYTLSDGVSTIDLVLWDSNRGMLGEKLKLLEPGRTIYVQGKVDEYQGKLQIHLNLPGDIQEAGAATAAVASAPEAGGYQRTEIGDLTRSALKRPVEIIGKVTGIRTFSKGRALEVTDPSGTMDVLIWDSLRKKMPGADAILKEGALLKVRGILGEYRGKLQVVPQSPDQVEESKLQE